MDALVFCAHPDDAELSMGGTIAKLSKDNLRVGIIDFTQGELGTRGTAEIRQKEAFRAALALKAAMRENFHLPDGDISINKENLARVITVIRKYRPTIIFAPYKNDRHPDHIHVSKIVKQAFFYSGLQKIKTSDKGIPQEAYRPQKIYYYMQSFAFTPSFIVDITDTYETKMKAVRCFDTQFHNPRSKEPETFISQPRFIKYIESRSQFYGFQIGRDYGEPFYCEEQIEVDMSSLVNRLKL